MHGHINTVYNTIKYTINKKWWYIKYYCLFIIYKFHKNGYFICYIIWFKYYTIYDMCFVFWVV